MSRIPSIVVIREGQHLRIEDCDSHPELDFRAQHIVGEREVEHGYRAVRRAESLYVQDLVRRPNLGLLPVIEQVARNTGITVNTAAGCTSTRPAPEVHTQNVARIQEQGDPHLIDFVQEYEQGIVEIGRRVDISSLILELIFAFPTGTFAIVGGHVPQLQSIAGRLRLHEIPVSVHDACRRPPPRQVVLSTYGGVMLNNEIQFSHREIVIFLDALHVTRQDACDALLMPDCRFRLYGILRRDRHVSPWVQSRLMAAFGPHRLVLPAHGRIQAAVNVASIPLTRPRLDPTEQDFVVVKRRGYWQHPPRNRRVAHVARALAAGDAQRLQDHPGILRWLGERVGLPINTVVLVENLEHALALVTQMQGSPIIAAAEPFLDGLSESQQRCLHAPCSSLMSTPNIITAAAAPTTRLQGVDVIFWAGGGPHLPPIPGHWLTRPSNTDQPRVLVVDFADRHHPLLGRWTAARRRACVSNDWFDTDVAPAEGRIERFLAGQRRSNRT